MSSHALLLRLFVSPGFFSVLRALQYIRNYSDSIGITHYLTRRLSSVPVDELADKWMLIWYINHYLTPLISKPPGHRSHLLVTRPSKSTALEVFVLRKAEESTLLALLTLYFFQATLNDLALRRNTESFAICSRILRSVTQIIFSDPTSQPFSQDGTFSLIPKTKVRPNVSPAIVGIGTVLASCPALPAISHVIGEVAIEQGRGGDGHHLSLQTAETLQPARVVTQSIEKTQGDDDSDSFSEKDDESKQSEVEEDIEAYGLALIAARENSNQLSTTTFTTPPSPSLTRRKTLSSLTTPRVDKSSQKASHRRVTSNQPNSTSPSLPNIHSHLNSSSPLYQSCLLRSHYLHSEVQFLQTLSAIADRLLVIPKPARICLPLWCNHRKEKPFNTDAQAHHQIVRIPPSECVVLNSAERAPFILWVEVLKGQLDFYPSSPGNRELLSTLQRDGPSPIREISPVSIGQENFQSIAHTSSPLTSFSQRTSDVNSNPGRNDSVAVSSADEEMDVVEQLYGANISLRSVNVDLTDSIVLPAPPRNKALDIANWSRRSTSNPPTPGMSSSMPASPITTQEHHRSQPSTSYRHSSLGSVSPTPAESSTLPNPPLSLDDYSNRMEAAAVMLAQLNANLVREPVTNAFGEKPTSPEPSSGVLSWIPGSGWIMGSGSQTIGADGTPIPAPQLRMRLQPSEAAAIRKRIMEEMMALEGERMARMQHTEDGNWNSPYDRRQTAEDEGIVRRELDKLDPSAAVFQESFTAKKARIRAASQYGHLLNWDCISVIVKTGADLRQEQLAGLLIQEFSRIWREENCPCWLRYFRILITGSNSGLVETITDAVSVHSIKKAEYARRLVEGKFTNVSLKDYFISTYGDPSSAKFARAQKNFLVSLAGYSVVSYLLQIKDRHNGNLLLDRDGHIIHIDFGFILESSPGGNLGFEAAPFKLPLEYVELLGGLDSKPWNEFKQCFRHGFETARKHCDSIITIVELMQKDSTFQCFSAFGEQTAQRLRDRFQPTLTHSLIEDHVEKLIAASIGSAWTRLYDSYQYYSQGIL
ncbi:Phosphatidylinositol 4-kinase pik1alpha (PI4-kinase)(PtdIns-4-kinase) [Serendipita sp. 407]|nr:Phosphatidylinositol 4-kinase pik1alpha (PI4-kinase)(PtdIns-4-kinase) [Serendipita sp. 407]